MSAPICTTLNAIAEHDPCAEGWDTLLEYLGERYSYDEPLPLVTILDSNGLGDALWALRSVKGHDREIRLYAVWCARQVQHLMDDPRSLAALDIAERYAHGEATDEELGEAYDAARDAAREDVQDVMRDAARYAARYAACLHELGDTTRKAAREAVSASGSCYTLDAQSAEFRRVFGGAA